MSEPFFGGFIPMPPEMREQMEQAHARHEMEASDIRHRIVSMFHEVDEDQLTALRAIFSSLSSAPGRQSRAMSSYYEGVASTLLHERFHICLGCGENHDKILMDAMKDEPAGDSTGQHVHVEPTTEPVHEPKQMKGAVVPSLFPDPRTVPDELQPGDLERMAEYNLDDLRDEDTLKLLGFRCMGCDMKYQSIEDRALRPAGIEGCEGCINKQKWG